MSALIKFKRSVLLPVPEAPITCMCLVRTSRLRETRAMRPAWTFSPSASPSRQRTAFGAALVLRVSRVNVGRSDNRLRQMHEPDKFVAVQNHPGAAALPAKNVLRVGLRRVSVIRERDEFVTGRVSEDPERTSEVPRDFPGPVELRASGRDAGNDRIERPGDFLLGVPHKLRGVRKKRFARIVRSLPAGCSRPKDSAPAGK